MDCKEFERKIPSFLQNNMDYESMEEFHKHMSECNNCKEELSIQFLVQEGIRHLENGDAFNLDEELNGRIEANRKSHARKAAALNSFQWILTSILFLVGAALIVIFG